MREMSTFDSNNDLFMPSNFKYVNVNRLSQKNREQKFLVGLQNAKSIIGELERSIKKSERYEEKLFKCKKSHSHSHDINEWWESDVSNSRFSKCSGESNHSKLNTCKSQNVSLVKIDESLSSINLFCLQNKYEDLLKRYEILSKLYVERCSLLTSRDVELATLRLCVKKTDDELQRVNRALLLVGKQYIDLKCKRFFQKVWYEERLFHLKCSMEAILSSAERARIELDDKLESVLNSQQDAAVSLLLAEIKKCNLLLLENLRLKYRM
ncbi:uncharacterized protein LOC116772589 [Danaus plexippus]|uniref:uncharacterized protein LOC116772589 n=1 Tax=Danaus plexippus TaxID=13037 RepID=UPI002AB0AD1B|nr:uncharacterized protein LOC116772589 [Danaus plexippus]